MGRVRGNSPRLLKRTLTCMIKEGCSFFSELVELNVKWIDFVQQLLTCTLSEESSNPRSNILSAPFSLQRGGGRKIRNKRAELISAEGLVIL